MKRWRIGVALVISFLLVIPLVGPGCSDASVTNPYDFSSFTRLDVQNTFDTQVTQSSTFSVTITSSKALLDYLSVQQEGETLVIKIHPNNAFTDFVTMRKILKARITMPAISGITLSGASKCVVNGFKSANTLDIDVSGASSLNLNGVETGNVNLTVSGNSQITGKLTAANVKIDDSGASQIKLQGTGEDIQLNASGAAKVSLEEFINQTATITLSGSSQATVDTRRHLDVSLSGASRFFFLSNPSFGKTEVMGASTLKHK